MNKKIGSFIKQLREENGYSQRELSEKLHVSRQTVSKWEVGKSSCSAIDIKILSDLFGVSPNEIINGERNAKDGTLKLYDKYVKLNKKYFITFSILILVILLYFIYYFINQYNSVHIYTISS